jgi:hypothetical protein
MRMEVQSGELYYTVSPHMPIRLVKIGQRPTFYMQIHKGYYTNCDPLQRDG